jgi:hypothetical protein
MAIAVSAYAFGTDSGTESTHPLGTTNAALSRSKTDAGTFLVRFLIQATGAGQNNIDFQLQRSLDGAAFANVTTTSTGVKAVATAVFVDQANTTSRLGGTGTFETTSAGCSETGLCGGTAFDIIADGRGETLYAVQLVPADLTAVSTITFKLLADGADFTQSVTPTINLTDPNVTALPSTGSVSLRGQAPTVAAAAAATTALAALAFTGVAPGWSIGVGVTPAAGAVALVGLLPTVAGGGGLTERLTPNAVVAGGSNLRDTDLVSPPVRMADIADDTSGSPGPDELWWTALNEEGDVDVRLAFSTSSGNLVGTQTINILVRGTSLPSRQVTAELWESGAKLTSEVTEAISSIDGQIVTLQFEPGELSDITGAGVELRIFSTAA